MYFLTDINTSINCRTLESVNLPYGALDCTSVYVVNTQRSQGVDIGPFCLQSDIGDVYVDIVPGPTLTSTQHSVKSIHVNNTDNITHNLEFSLFGKILFKCSLDPGYTVCYYNEEGWKVFDNFGIQLTGSIKKSGYEILSGISNNNPADNTNYYFGKIIAGTFTTVDGSRQMPIFRDGVITKVHFNVIITGLLGTSEQSTFYIRVNNSIDYVVTTTITMNSVSQSFTINDLNIPISEGDQIQIKWLTPAWLINPTSVYIATSIWVEAE